MTENELSGKIIGLCIEVHKTLGPGLLEKVYEEALCYELLNAGLRSARQMPVPIRYKNAQLDSKLFLDLIVEDLVIVELNAKEKLSEIDKPQVLTYLKLTKKRLGLIVNFHERRLVDGVHRIVNGLPDQN